MNRYLNKLSRAIIAMAISIIPAVVMAQPAPPDSTLQLPRRQNRLVIDGDLKDWKGPSLKIVLADPDVPSPLRNTGVFQLVWDSNFLWFAVTIEDSEVYQPPEQITGSAIHQWDSIEIYIDGHGNRSTRMDENDTQLIVSCNGLNGAMHGDEMLHNVEDWLVPKRKHLGLAVQTAALRSATGYTVEGAFPWSAVDVVEAKRGQVVALDLAWNDWIEDHPQLPELQENLENLAAIFNNETKLEISDPNDLGWSGWTAWEARAYRPYAWRSGSNFGHPAQWQLVQLVGQPPLAEALVDRWGLVPLLVVTFIFLLMISLLIDLRLRRRYQLRVRDLVARIEELTPQTKQAPLDSHHWSDHLADKMSCTPTDSPDSGDTLNNIFVQINNNISKTLTVGDLATALNVSSRTLQRICQDDFGATPRDVILAVKMRRAHEALVTGKWRVGEVAAQVGFDSPYYFSRRFKDFFDCPPSMLIPSRQAK